MKRTQLTARCSKCGSEYELEGSVLDWRGRSITCPQCRNVFPALGGEGGLPQAKGRRLLAFCIIILALGVASAVTYIWVGASRARHRESLEKQALAKQAALVPVTPKKPRLELEGADFFPSKEASRALKKFVEYRDSLLAGQFDQASNCIFEIKTLLPDVQEEKNFWKEVEDTVGKVVTLRLLYLCPQCKGPEICTSCKGSGICVTCNGEKVCQVCKETPPISTSVCQRCVCQRCRGTGICGTCQGYGTIDCPNCRGVGNIRSRTQVTCRFCGGKGAKPGLANMIRCYQCGGSGSVVKLSLEQCPNCNKGRIRCPVCNGGKTCLTCGGTGKLPTNYSASGQKREVDVICNGCLGSGKCKDCEGLGRCRNCKGAGQRECVICGSSGLIHCMVLPVASNWLSVANGCWYSSGNELSEVVIDGSGKIQLEDRQVKLGPETFTNEVVVICATRPYGIFKNLKKEESE